MSQVKTTQATGFRQDVQGMGQSVRELKGDLSSLASGVSDAARSGAAEVRVSARHAVDAAKGTIEDATLAAGEAADSLRSVVARNPMATIGVAAGAGLLLGLLLRRSRN